jgi:hypothetical protein
MLLFPLFSPLLSHAHPTKLLPPPVLCRGSSQLAADDNQSFCLKTSALQPLTHNSGFFICALQPRLAGRRGIGRGWLLEKRERKGSHSEMSWLHDIWASSILDRSHGSASCCV